MHDRDQPFDDDNAASSGATTFCTSLDDLIGKLECAKADQSPTRVSKEKLLDSLLHDLKNISRAAHSIELNENSFAAPYR